MMKFSDQLFTDLMREHAATLQTTELPAAARGHSAVRRGAWLAGGAGPSRSASPRPSRPPPAAEAPRPTP